MAKIISHKKHESGIALGGIGTGSVELFPDGEAMMNRKGEKTRTWYHVQKVNKEVT